MKQKSNSRFKGRFRILTFLLVAFICFIIFLKAEFSLRNSGYYPGTISTHSNFKIDDDLEESGNFITDSFGIFRVSPSGVDSLRVFFSTDFDNPDPAGTYENSFFSFIDSLKNLEKNNIALKSADSAYIIYSRQPVNEDGFRSIPFKNIRSEAKKILLLGDSFTWGAHANPITNSFADLLAVKGYVVYNSGIGGTDPAQYQRIAEVWVPQLEPDVIIVNFYYGNDIMYYERDTGGCKPMYYTTTIGLFESSPNGKYCFPDYWTAYQFYKGFYGIPSNTFFNRLCRQSSLLSKLWVIFRKWGLVNNISNFNEYAPEEFSKYLVPNPPVISSSPVSEKYLTAIKNIAAKNEAIFILSVIPVSASPDSSAIEPRLKDVFGNLEYHVPQNLTAEDYYPFPDGHFNNTGHKKYAAFLDSLFSMQDVNRGKY